MTTIRITKTVVGVAASLTIVGCASTDLELQVQARQRAEADLKVAQSTIADDKRKYDEAVAAQERLKTELQQASVRSKASSTADSSTSGSPYARAVQFTTIVRDKATPNAAGQVQHFTKGVNVAVPVTGWKCRTTSVSNGTLPAPRVTPPTPIPTQQSVLACAYQPPAGADWTHAAGVSVWAACALATTDDEAMETITLHDPAGHEAEVVLWCRNH